MPCFSPITGYIAKGKTDKGKKILVFKKPDDYMQQIDIPCGRCIGCKLRRSIEWAARCTQEMSLHEENCFITLTYNDKNLPYDYSLPSTEIRTKGQSQFQLFLKRLRKEISPIKISYFMCGEYGDNTWRPHYHAIIFGYSFPDKIRVQEQPVENPYYISPVLSRLWPFGNHIIANATFDTAAYVARYCTKKITGEKADSHYNRQIIEWNEFTGEVLYYKDVNLSPEYATMSRKPAIGKGWYDKYKKDCWPSDFLIQDGRKIPVPKYYEKQLEKESVNLYRVQKFKRMLKAMLKHTDKSLVRLRVQEDVKKAQFKSLEKLKI